MLQTNNEAAFTVDFMVDFKRFNNFSMLLLKYVDSKHNVLNCMSYTSLYDDSFHIL